MVENITQSFYFNRGHEAFSRDFFDDVVDCFVRDSSFEFEGFEECFEFLYAAEDRLDEVVEAVVDTVDAVHVRVCFEVVGEWCAVVGCGLDEYLCPGCVPHFLEVEECRVSEDDTVIELAELVEDGTDGHARVSADFGECLPRVLAEVAQ